MGVGDVTLVMGNPDESIAMMKVRNFQMPATFVCMAPVTGFASAVVILFVVLLFTHAARDLQSSSIYHQIRRSLPRSRHNRIL